MENKALNFFKNNINKQITNSLSPVGNWLKGVLKNAEEGELTIEFKIRPEMANPMGYVHGGIYSLIIDEIIGATVFTLNLDNHFVTVNLSVDYFANVKIGDTIKAVSKIVKQGKKIINVECQIYNLDNKLLAKGSSNLIKNIEIEK
ncbi:MAG: PaaI family thioesterase [Bacteroidales bacterium]|nr:PaaI family thioesterase [Bacteroidales bacterium]MBN2758765.1 PaaI family thioesterase [Bacteroidales bacterium]